MLVINSILIGTTPSYLKRLNNLCTVPNRFLNVISLFNGAIPLIALQMCATKLGDEICLNFVKVLDKTDLGTDDENEVEQTDRKYWSKRTDVLPIMGRIFEDVMTFGPGFDLKYN